MPIYAFGIGTLRDYPILKANFVAKNKLLFLQKNDWDMGFSVK